MLGQIDHVPEIRDLPRDGIKAARTGNVAMLDGVDEDTVDEEQARTVGAFYSALRIGVVIQ